MIPILALQLAGCVTLGMSLHLSEPFSSPVKLGKIYHLTMWL